MHEQEIKTTVDGVVTFVSQKNSTLTPKEKQNKPESIAVLGITFCMKHTWVYLSTPRVDCPADLFRLSKRAAGGLR